jgi:hypothetical protein
MMAGRRPLDDLPEELSYLKGPAADLVAQDDDLVGSGMGDWSAFESALRQAMAGLSRADAEERCRQHRRLLNDWLERARQAVT